jgi:hypothetical protein
MSSFRSASLLTLARRVLPSPLRKALWAMRRLQVQWFRGLRQWLYDRLPDRYVQASQFKRQFGRDLNLAAPTTFNEKLHWLMLHYRIPEMTQLADKYEARTLVAARVGDWLLNDLYGVWDDPWALAFDQLPNSFVLKVTSGCGQNILCQDKSRLDAESTRRRLAHWMKRSEYWVVREWAYKNIKPRIICERFLTDERGRIPNDYKYFCFNGEPRFVQVDTDRFTTNHRRDFFDLEWKWLPFNMQLPFNITYPSGGRDIPRPGDLETMISVARALSRGFPFVRVDLYSLRERVIFGEMTWYPGGGLGPFSPAIYDLLIGQVLTLPKPSGSSLAWRLRFGGFRRNQGNSG